jgi:general stress protein YciG
MGQEDRGFASMDPGKQRAIASKGGRAAHAKGTAHEWTSAEAREAGRKGGLTRHHRDEPQFTDERASADRSEAVEIDTPGAWRGKL